MLFLSGEIGAHDVRIASLEAAKDPTETANIGGNVHCSCVTLGTLLYVIVCGPGMTPRECLSQYFI